MVRRRGQLDTFAHSGFGLAGFLMLAMAFGAGCFSNHSGGNPRVEVDAGGTGGDDGPDNSLPEASGGGRSCSATPSGCFCIIGDGDPGTIAACGAASVVTSDGEQGVCCEESVLCACDAYLCRNEAVSGFCQCGRASTVSGGGAVVPECPPPLNGRKCCLSRDTNTCICAALDCDDGAVAVDRCSLGEVAVCLADSQIVASCK